MADPLTQTVEQFAPAPLNIFDQNQAETIISRYSGARRNLAGATEVANASQQAANARVAALREQRDRLLATREDQDYAERKQVETDRADLLGDMWGELRPDEDGFLERQSEFLQKAPPAVVQDPVFREVLAGMARRAEKLEAERAQNRELETRQKNTLEGIRERAKYNDTMRYLTEDDIAKLPRDEMGNLDMFAAGALAGQRKREAGVEDFKAKTDIRKKAAIELIDRRNMDEAQRERMAEVKDILIYDDEAFPRRSEMVLRKAVEAKKSPEYDPTFKAMLAEAKLWDKNLFEKEVNAAQDYDTPEAYVEVVGDISPKAKENRRRLWEYANQNRATSSEAAPAAPTETAPTPVAPTAAAPATKTITRQYIENGYAIREFSDGTKQRKKIPEGVAPQ